MKLSCSASEQISVIFLNSCLTLYKTWNIFRRQNHGTWKVGVDLEDHLVTTPAMGLSLDQVAQDVIQPGLEHRNMLVWPSQGYWKSPRAVVISREEQGQAEEGLRHRSALGEGGGCHYQPCPLEGSRSTEPAAMLGASTASVSPPVILSCHKPVTHCDRITSLTRLQEMINSKQRSTSRHQDVT